MCPPDRKSPARDQGPSKRAAPDTLQIGDGPNRDPKRKRGRDQVKTAPAASSAALNIDTDGSGLSI